jgi:hypothetical protein
MRPAVVMAEVILVEGKDGIVGVDDEVGVG